MMDEEQKIRIDLAAAYQILAKLNMDDLTYTHLSARSAKGNSFYIYPFGYLFKEVTASSLLEVSFDGEIISGDEYQYNQTGYVIHGEIYKNKPSINSIFHLHTISGVAISASLEGLLPISQFSFHFINNLAYHDYNSLALIKAHGNKLVDDLADNKAMILKNHGTLTCGNTIWEAFFYCYYLEQACKVQCKIMNSNMNPLKLDYDLALKARNDMLNFEQDLGKRDWLALIRDLERNKSNYKD